MKLKKLFEHSTLFHEGIIGKSSNRPSKFFIHDDIILITNRNGDELVTMYRVNFNYGTDEDGSIDREVARRLLKKILSLQEQRDQQKDMNKESSQNITYEIEDVRSQIKIAESTLSNLRILLKAKEDLLASVNTNIALLDTEIEQKSHQLINYVEYQKSLKD